MTRRREETRRRKKEREAKGRRDETLARRKGSCGDGMVVVVLGWIWSWGGLRLDAFGFGFV